MSEVSSSAQVDPMLWAASTRRRGLRETGGEGSSPRRGFGRAGERTWLRRASPSTTSLRRSATRPSVESGSWAAAGVVGSGEGVRMPSPKATSSKSEALRGSARPATLGVEGREEGDTEEIHREIGPEACRWVGGCSSGFAILVPVLRAATKVVGAGMARVSESTLAPVLRAAANVIGAGVARGIGIAVAPVRREAATREAPVFTLAATGVAQTLSGLVVAIGMATEGRAIREARLGPGWGRVGAEAVAVFRG